MVTNVKTASFLAVVHYGSFSKAAEHLYVSQPAVSKNIRQLEKDVGFPLIDRASGVLKLTNIGKLYYEYFSESEKRYGELLEKVSDYAKSRNDDIRIGCLDGWDISWFFPEIKENFKRNFPEISLSLEGYDHVALITALEEERIDIAMTLSLALPRTRRLLTRTITTAPVVALFSTSNPLAEKKNLSLIDFRNEPFFIIAPEEQPKNQNNPMERLTHQLCLKAGFEPKIEYLPSSTRILMALQAGRGVQLTCAWTSARQLPIYQTLQLDHKINVCVAWMDSGNISSKHLFVGDLLHLDLDNLVNKRANN